MEKMLSTFILCILAGAVLNAGILFMMPAPPEYGAIILLLSLMFITLMGILACVMNATHALLKKLEESAQQ